MIDMVILEWEFTPIDYFEQVIEVSRNDCAMTITDGKVEAKIESSIYNSNPSILQDLQRYLNARFLAVQVQTHRPYKLSSSRVTQIHTDGRRVIEMICESGYYVMSGGFADFQIVDKSGNVIIDSKRDRIEKKKRFSESVATYFDHDETLRVLLRSYNASVKDPNNELIHLYEIRDALVDKFGSENNVRSNLDITATDWSHLGKICNSLPVRQGRHRGKMGINLRDASESELIEARSISRSMIESYVQYLGSSVK